MAMIKTARQAERALDVYHFRIFYSFRFATIGKINLWTIIYVLIEKANYNVLCLKIECAIFIYQIIQSHKWGANHFCANLSAFREYWTLNKIYLWIYFSLWNHSIFIKAGMHFLVHKIYIISNNTPYATVLG